MVLCLHLTAVSASVTICVMEIL